MSEWGYSKRAHIVQTGVQNPPIRETLREDGTVGKKVWGVSDEN